MINPDMKNSEIIKNRISIVSNKIRHAKDVYNVRAKDMINLINYMSGKSDFDLNIFLFESKNLASAIQLVNNLQTQHEELESLLAVINE